MLEAGGCSSKAIGNPGPDCIYVDQVKSTILQLDGIDLSIDERLETASTPLVCCVDWFFPSSSDKLESFSNLSVLSKLHHMSSTAPSPANKKVSSGNSVLRTHMLSPSRSSQCPVNGHDTPEGRNGIQSIYHIQLKSLSGFISYLNNGLFQVLLHLIMSIGNVTYFLYL